MFGFIKNLMRRPAKAPAAVENEAPADQGYEAEEQAPVAPPPRQSSARHNGGNGGHGGQPAGRPSASGFAPQAQRGTSPSAATPPPPNSPGAVRAVQIPLQPILDSLPLELQPRVREPQVGDALVSIPIEKILSQLSRGSVKITFGELRQAAPGIFSSEIDRDRVAVPLPLQEILSRLNPALIARRRVQKHIEVPQYISSPFDPGNESSICHVGPSKPEPRPAPQPAAAPAQQHRPAINPVPQQQMPQRNNSFSAPTPPPPAAAPLSPSMPFGTRPGTAPRNPAPLPPQDFAPDMFQMTPPQAPQAPQPPQPRAHTPPPAPPTPRPAPAPAAPAASPFELGASAPIKMSPSRGFTSAPQPTFAPSPSVQPPQAPAPAAFQPPVTPQAPARPASPIQMASPFQMQAPATPAPAPTPAPAAPRPAPAPANTGECLTVPLMAMAESWPESIRKEAVELNLLDAKLALPVELIGQAMKQGRIAFPWKQLRSWIKSSGLPLSSSNDNVVVELPLRLIAPAFLNHQKQNGKDKQRVNIDAEIPNLFFGFPQGEAAEAAEAPASNAVTKPVDTNYYTWDQASDTAHLAAQGIKKQTVETRFASRCATPNEIVSKAAALEGVAGALIALPDGLMVASQISPDLNGETLAAFLPQIFAKMTTCTKELRMGELNNLHFTVGNVPWKIFRVNAIFFAVFGRAGEALPTAQLTALAVELDHKPK